MRAMIECGINGLHDFYEANRIVGCLSGEDKKRKLDGYLREHALRPGDRFIWQRFADYIYPA